MDTEAFDAGIRHLEIMFNTTMSTSRRSLYHEALSEIPTDLWAKGIDAVCSTARYFPTVAEIGEACVPGEAKHEEIDKWTRLRVTVETPWTERLASLLPASPLLLPAPVAPSLEELPLSYELPRTEKGRQAAIAEFERLGGNDLPAEARAEFWRGIEESKRREQQEPIESLQPRLAWHRRTPGVLNTNSSEYQALSAYWTKERMEQRREFLHRQLAWLGRRDEAERNGEKFSEPSPQEPIDNTPYPTWTK